MKHFKFLAINFFAMYNLDPWTKKAMGDGVDDDDDEDHIVANVGGSGGGDDDNDEVIVCVAVVRTHARARSNSVSGDHTRSVHNGNII